MVESVWNSDHFTRQFVSQKIKDGIGRIGFSAAPASAPTWFTKTKLKVYAHIFRDEVSYLSRQQQRAFINADTRPINEAPWKVHSRRFGGN